MIPNRLTILAATAFLAVLCLVGSPQASAQSLSISETMCEGAPSSSPALWCAGQSNEIQGGGTAPLQSPGAYYAAELMSLSATPTQISFVMEVPQAFSVNSVQCVLASPPNPPYSFSQSSTPNGPQIDLTVPPGDTVICTVYGQFPASAAGANVSNAVQVVGESSPRASATRTVALDPAPLPVNLSISTAFVALGPSTSQNGAPNLHLASGPKPARVRITVETDTDTELLSFFEIVGQVGANAGLAPMIVDYATTGFTGDYGLFSCTNYDASGNVVGSDIQGNCLEEIFDPGPADADPNAAPDDLFVWGVGAGQSVTLDAGGAARLVLEFDVMVETNPAFQCSPASGPQSIFHQPFLALAGNRDVIEDADPADNTATPAHAAVVTGLFAPCNDSGISGPGANQQPVLEIEKRRDLPMGWQRHASTGQGGSGFWGTIMRFIVQLLTSAQAGANAVFGWNMNQPNGGVFNNPADDAIYYIRIENISADTAARDILLNDIVMADGMTPPFTVELVEGEWLHCPAAPGIIVDYFQFGSFSIPTWMLPNLTGPTGMVSGSGGMGANCDGLVPGAPQTAPSNIPGPARFSDMSTPHVFSPPGAPSIQGYNDSVTVWEGRIAQLRPGEAAVLRVSMNYRDPWCDGAPGQPQAIRNIFNASYTAYRDTGSDVETWTGNARASRVDPIEAPEACQFEVEKTVTDANFDPISPQPPLIFGQDYHYSVEFTNNMSTPQFVGTVMDALRIATPGYAVSLDFEYEYDCFEPNPGSTPITGYSTANTPTGTNNPARTDAVVYPTSTAPQGTRIISQPTGQFVEFPAQSTLRCEITINVQRPALSDPNCLSSVIPQMENTAVMNNSLFFNANLPFPTGPQGEGWDAVSSDMARCYDLGINKTADTGEVDPSLTHPTGGPIEYRVTLINNGDLLDDPLFGPGYGPVLEDVSDPLHWDDLFNIPNATNPCPSSANADCTEEDPLGSDHTGTGANHGEFAFTRLESGSTLLNYELENGVGATYGGQTFNNGDGYDFDPITNQICNTVTFEMDFPNPGVEALWYARGQTDHDPVTASTCVSVWGAVEVIKTVSWDPNHAHGGPLTPSTGSPNTNHNFPISITCQAATPNLTNAQNATVSTSNNHTYLGLPFNTTCTVTEPQTPIPDPQHPGCYWIPDPNGASTVVQTDLLNNQITLDNLYRCYETRTLRIIKELDNQTSWSSLDNYPFPIEVECTLPNNLAPNPVTYTMDVADNSSGGVQHVPVFSVCRLGESLAPTTNYPSGPPPLDNLPPQCFVTAELYEWTDADAPDPGLAQTLIPGDPLEDPSVTNPALAPEFTVDPIPQNAANQSDPNNPETVYLNLENTVACAPLYDLEVRKGWGIAFVNSPLDTYQTAPVIPQSDWIPQSQWTSFHQAQSQWYANSYLQSIATQPTLTTTCTPPAGWQGSQSSHTITTPLTPNAGPVTVGGVPEDWDCSITETLPPPPLNCAWQPMDWSSSPNDGTAFHVSPLPNPDQNGPPSATYDPQSQAFLPFTPQNMLVCGPPPPPDIDLDIEKEIDPNNCDLGGTCGYDISIVNNGPDTFHFPSFLTFSDEFVTGSADTLVSAEALGTTPPSPLACPGPINGQVNNTQLDDFWFCADNNPSINNVSVNQLLSGQILDYYLEFSDFDVDQDLGEVENCVTLLGWDIDGVFEADVWNFHHIISRLIALGHLQSSWTQADLAPAIMNFIIQNNLQGATTQDIYAALLGPAYDPANPPMISPVSDCETVELPVPNLEIEKIKLTPGDCHQYGSTQCTFRIRITNNGSDPYTGPLEFEDAVGIANDHSVLSGPGWPQSLVSWTSPQAGWTCQQNTGWPPVSCNNSGVSLAANGGSTFIDLTVDLAGPAPMTINCAEITLPTPLANVTNPGPLVGGDTDCADIDTPLPVPAELVIEKELLNPDDCLADCRFRVTITNNGSSDYNGPVSFADAVGLENDPGIIANNYSLSDPPHLAVMATTPPGGDWVCSPHTETGIACTELDVTIPGNGGTLTIDYGLVLHGGDAAANCVELTVPPSTATGVPTGPIEGGPADCVPIAPVLEIEKTSAGGCEPSANGPESCEFTVSITNAGNEDYTGDLSFADFPSNGTMADTQNWSSSAMALFASGDAGWTCVNNTSGSPPIHCTTDNPVTIPAGQSLDYTFTVETSQHTQFVSNCVELTEPFTVDHIANNYPTPATGTGPGPVSGGPAACAEVWTGLMIRKETVGGQCHDPNAAMRPDPDRCTFEIMVGNPSSTDYSGPLTIDDAAGYAVDPSLMTTPLPAGEDVTVVGQATNGWNCVDNAAWPPVTCDHSGVSIPAGGSVSFEVELEFETATRLIGNCAEITATDGVTSITGGPSCDLLDDIQPDQYRIIPDTPDGPPTEQLYCDPETAMPGRDEESCICRSPDMVQISDTRCRCPVYTTLTPDGRCVPDEEPDRLQCDDETSMPNPDGAGCVCRIDGMEPTSATSCACPAGTELGPNGICVAPEPESPQCDRSTTYADGGQCICMNSTLEQVSPTSCACPAGTEMGPNGVCRAPEPERPQCDLSTTFESGGECLCRNSTMERISPTRCGCPAGTEMGPAGMCETPQRSTPATPDCPARHAYNPNLGQCVPLFCSPPMRMNENRTACICPAGQELIDGRCRDTGLNLDNAVDILSPILTDTADGPNREPTRDPEPEPDRGDPNCIPGGPVPCQ